MNRLAQVCEHWRQLIITSPALWSTIDLSSLSESRFPMERFRRLHQENRLFQSVQHIDLSNWKADMAKKMLEFLADCSQYDLHSLSIRRCRNIASPFLQSVIAHAGNLRLLNISGITVCNYHRFITKILIKFLNLISGITTAQLPESIPNTII